MSQKSTCLNAQLLIEIIKQSLSREEANSDVRFTYDPNDIHVIKLFGSRAYGSAQEDSDYDFIVVCREFQVQNYYRSIEGMKHAVKHERDYMFDVDWTLDIDQSESSASDSGCDVNEEESLNRSIHIGVHILNSEYYMEMVQEHEATMVLSMFLDGTNQIWMEDEDMTYYRTVLFPMYGLMLRKVQRGFARVVDIAYSKSNRIWSDDAYKSAKNMAHSYRYLTYAKQIVEHGRIVDFTEPNNICAQVVSCFETCRQWNDMKELYYKPYYSMRENLKEFVKERVDNFQLKHVGSLTNLINECGISVLNKYYSIHVVPYGTNCFYLKRDPKMASRSNLISQSCNGCIVRYSDTTGCSMVCAVPIMYDVKSLDDKMDLDGYKCYLKPKGMQFSLFFDEEWKLCSEMYESEFTQRISTGKMNGNSISESEQVIWSKWRELNYELPSDTRITFTFILTGDSIALESAVSINGVEENFIELATRYQWSHLTPMTIQSMTGLREFLNNPNLVNPLSFTGALLIKPGCQRVEVKSTLYNSLDKLNVWDVSMVRSSNDSIPFQGIESESNTYALLDILRLYSLEDATDERTIEENYPLFLPTYRSMKSAVIKAFNFIDQQFRLIRAKASADQFRDRAQFARLVDSALNKKHLRRLRTCMYMMWSLDDAPNVCFQKDIRTSIEPRLMHHIWLVGLSL